MHTGSFFAARLVAGLLCAVPAVAQSWGRVAIGAPIPFGASGDLIAADATGLVGYDETAGRTRLPGAVGWSAHFARPGQRRQTMLAASNGRVYLFGGATSAGLRGDLWRFDRSINDWIARPPLVSGPSPRIGARAAAVGGTFPLLLFGGASATGLPNDTWGMMDLPSAAAWVSFVTPPALLGRTDHAMVQGPRQSVVLFGGQRAQPLGDTWVFRGTTWTQYTGTAPPAAARCRMAYDAGRDMVVLVHPNGETWEWNDFTWRRVGILASPAWLSPAVVADPAHGDRISALQNEPAGFVTYAFTPSPAAYEVMNDLVCVANGFDALELFAFERSLPILGQTLHLRALGLLPSSAFVMAFERSFGPPMTRPVACGCMLSLTGLGTATHFVAGIGTVRDWFLPIPNLPVLSGIPIDVQGFLLDAAAPCWLMTTQGGTLTPGR